jgi:hypothetical protein
VAVAVATAAVMAWAGGCAQVTARTAPNVNVAGFKHYYVVHVLTDGHGVDQAIARELRGRGYDATYGPRTEMPENTDAAVIYEDHWNFDFTNYMIGVDMQVRTPRTDKPLAIVHVFQPSVMGHTPAEVIDIALDKLHFKPRAPLPPLPPASNTPDLSVH